MVLFGVSCVVQLFNIQFFAHVIQILTYQTAKNRYTYIPNCEKSLYLHTKLRKIAEHWHGQVIVVDGIVIGHLLALKRGLGAPRARGTGRTLFFSLNRGHVHGTCRAHGRHHLRLEDIQVLLSWRNLATRNAWRQSAGVVILSSCANHCVALRTLRIKGGVAVGTCDCACTSTRRGRGWLDFIVGWLYGGACASVVLGRRHRHLVVVVIGAGCGLHLDGLLAVVGAHHRCLATVGAVIGVDGEVGVAFLGRPGFGGGELDGTGTVGQDNLERLGAVAVGDDLGAGAVGTVVDGSAVQLGGLFVVVVVVIASIRLVWRLVVVLVLGEKGARELALEAFVHA